MALAFQSGESVKQALFEELQNLLSTDRDIRTNSENRIKQLEFTEGMSRQKFINRNLVDFIQIQIIRVHACIQVMVFFWPNSQ